MPPELPSRETYGFGTGSRSGTVQSPTRPFRSKLPARRLAGDPTSGQKPRYFGIGSLLAGTLQSPTWPFRSKLPLSCVPTRWPQKTPSWVPSGVVSFPETEPSVPTVAVTCCGTPSTMSVPVTELLAAVPVKLIDFWAPLGSVNVVE